MFSYVAYGLRITSALALPELAAGTAEEQVTVRFGRVDLPPGDPDAPFEFFAPAAEEIFVAWKGEGRFLIRGGKEIIIDPEPGVPQEILRLIILGPALAMLLYQRGLVVLHASGVVVKGGAAIFLGESGLGKSTLAAALHAQGHPVVADDVVAVNCDSPYPMVFPGFPQLKICPEMARYLGKVPGTMPKTHPQEEKRAFRTEQGFSRHPVALRRIYILTEGEAPALEPLPAGEALIELVRHSYRLNLLHAFKGATNLLRCGDIVDRVAVCRLISPKNLGALPSLARIVEQDIETAPRMR